MTTGKTVIPKACSVSKLRPVMLPMIAPAAEKVGPRGERSLTEYLTALEQQAALTTLDNLMTFPWVKALVESGHLKLHAAYFGVATGDLSVYDPASGKFMRITADAHAKAFASPRF